MRMVLRHKAFKALLRQYNPEVYKLLKSEYLDLSYELEAIYSSAVTALHRHAMICHAFTPSTRKADRIPTSCKSRGWNRNCRKSLAYCLEKARYTALAGEDILHGAMKIYFGDDISITS